MNSISPYELRLGNVIKFIGADHRIQLDAELLSAILTQKGFIDSFEGVPLTPDILSECGGVGNGQGIYDFFDLSFFLRPSAGAYKVVGIGHLVITYLHEFQNLFRVITKRELYHDPHLHRR